jgi:hypothetical protein
MIRLGRHFGDYSNHGDIGEYAHLLLTLTRTWTVSSLRVFDELVPRTSARRLDAHISVTLLSER